MSEVACVQKQIEEFASKAFASHKIDQRMYLFESFDRYYGHWVCTKDGSGSNVYRFDILHKPGTLVVTGDIGDLIVERTSNMIAWCQGSVDSISYFAEKVPHAIKTREPSQDKRQRYVETMLEPCLAYDLSGEFNEWGQHIAGETEAWEELYVELSRIIDDKAAPDVFMQTLYDSPLCNDCDWLPDLTDWTANFLWCREAVKWFCNNWEGPYDPSERVSK